MYSSNDLFFFSLETQLLVFISIRQCTNHIKNKNSIFYKLVMKSKFSNYLFNLNFYYLFNIFY